MEKFGMYVKFTTQPGRQGEFVQLLLEAAAGMQAVKECELYIVGVSETEPETVWVTEVWNDAAAHQASLQNEEAKALIQRARPLIAAAEQIRLRPLGGKGI